jgi:hypothetical protein
MRRFSREQSYDAPAAALLELWRDPAFLAALGERFGGVGTPVISEVGDRVRVTTQRKLPLDKVPSLVRRFVGSGTLEQTDDWPKEALPPIEGSFEVRGTMPATMTGTQAIRPEGDGCRVTVEGTVSVSVPVVAGRAEELIVREITKLIGAQQEFAAAWLPAHPS